MNKQRARQLYELANRLSKLDVKTLSEEQRQQRSAMIAKLQEEAQIIKEFAPDAGDGGEEETLRKYARIWYNGDESTQQQVEQILDRMGWEIGELESEEGGAFVVQAGDENGDSYIGFAVADLTENLRQAASPTKIISADDRNGVITVVVQANDGSKRSIANSNPNYINQWLLRFGLTLPRSITSKFVGVREDVDGEYNDEAGMAKGSLQTMSRAVSGLMDTIQQGDNLPEWAQEKLSLAEDYLTTVWDYLLSQKEQGIEPKLEEASQRVDSLVTDALKLMRGPELTDAVQALKTVLGDREFSSRRGHYNFFIRQMMDMYRQRGVNETKKPSPKLTPVNMKKTDPVSEEINTEAYERLQKVFAFKNYES